jgi:hypothetical protein
MLDNKNNALSNKCVITIIHEGGIREVLGEVRAEPRQDGTVHDCMAWGLLVYGAYFPSRPGSIVEQFSANETVRRPASTRLATAPITVGA